MFQGPASKKLLHVNRQNPFFCNYLQYVEEYCAYLMTDSNFLPSIERLSETLASVTADYNLHMNKRNLVFKHSLKALIASQKREQLIATFIPLFIQHSLESNSEKRIANKK